MDIFLDKYIDIVLLHSLNLKKGDVLSINTEECNSRLAHIIANKAQRITGNGTFIQLLENGKVVETEEAATDYPITKKPTVLLYIPTYKEYTEPEIDKIYTAPELQDYKLLAEPLYNPVPAIPYISVPTPNKAWASYIDEDGDEGVISSMISELLSLEEDNFIENLKDQNGIIRYEKDKLNALRLKEGRITTEEGSDLEFRFLENSIFATTEQTTTNGRTFIPTIYSSDIFRALDKNSLNGYLNITKPIMLFGKVINNLSLTFKNGSITDFSTDEYSAQLFNLYLNQDRDSGKASMLSIAEETNIASVLDYFAYPEWDRMRSTSIVIGTPRPECLEEKDKEKTVDSLVSLYLPLGSDSLMIEAYDESGQEHIIVEDGIIQEEE